MSYSSLEIELEIFFLEEILFGPDSDDNFEGFIQVNIDGEIIQGDYKTET